MTETAPEGADTAPTDQPPADLAAEAEKWKALAQKHEARAKTNADAAKELDTLRKSSMTELEKAVEAARAEERAVTLRSVGGRLVDAEVRAAATGRLSVEQIGAHLEVLDRSRFITDDGDVDRDALTKWVERIAPATPPAPPRFGDVDAGVRKTPPTPGDDLRGFARKLFADQT